MAGRASASLCLTLMSGPTLQLRTSWLPGTAAAPPNGAHTCCIYITHNPCACPGTRRLWVHAQTFLLPPARPQASHSSPPPCHQARPCAAMRVRATMRHLPQPRLRKRFRAEAARSASCADALHTLLRTTMAGVSALSDRHANAAQSTMRCMGQKAALASEASTSQVASTQRGLPVAAFAARAAPTN